MKRLVFAAAAAALTLAAAIGCSSGGGGGSPTPSPSPTPVISTLQNDGYTGGTPTYNGGFVTGEGVAVVFDGQTKGFEVQKVLFPFGGAGTAETVTLKLYDDTGATNPGTPLFSGDFALTPSDGTLQQIDLSAQHIAVPAGQAIRVEVLFQHDALPTVGVDAAALVAGHNYVFSATGWTDAGTAGLTHNFIIRAEIATPP